MKKQVGLMMDSVLHEAACTHAKGRNLNFSQLITALVQAELEPKKNSSSEHVADLRQQVIEKQAIIEGLMRMLEQERQIRAVSDYQKAQTLGKPERRSAAS